jgi:hypothetical protein
MIVVAVTFRAREVRRGLVCYCVHLRFFGLLRMAVTIELAGQKKSNWQFRNPNGSCRIRNRFCDPYFVGE